MCERPGRGAHAPRFATRCWPHVVLLYIWLILYHFKVGRAGVCALGATLPCPFEAVFDGLKTRERVKSGRCAARASYLAPPALQ